MDLDGNSFEVIEDFLPKQTFVDLSQRISSSNFPWFWGDAVADPEDAKNFYFTHTFYSDSSIKSAAFNSVLMPLLNSLPNGDLYRVKANLFVRQNDKLTHGKHVDLKNAPPNFHTAIYYVNDTDGDTIIYGQDCLEIKARVSPKANRLVIFDGDISHTGCSPTQHKTRILLNSNFRLTKPL